MERFKYGICLNEECEKCRTKEVQQIPMRRDFVCATCGKELRECPPPKKGGNVKKIVFAVIGLLLIALLVFLLTPRKTEGEVSPVDSLQVQTDSVPVIPEDGMRSDTVVNTTRDSSVHVEGGKVTRTVEISRETTITTNTVSRQVRPAEGGGKSTLNLSYGKYVGEVKGGYPNGMGRLTYNQTRTINRYDQKGRTANQGDYVIGEFVNGFLVQGKHYGADGNLIESLIIGVAPEDVYEAK